MRDQNAGFAGLAQLGYPLASLTAGRQLGYDFVGRLHAIPGCNIALTPFDPAAYPFSFVPRGCSLCLPGDPLLEAAWTAADVLLNIPYNLRRARGVMSGPANHLGLASTSLGWAFSAPLSREAAAYTAQVDQVFSGSERDQAHSCLTDLDRQCTALRAEFAALWLAANPQDGPRRLLLFNRAFSIVESGGRVVELGCSLAILAAEHVTSNTAHGWIVGILPELTSCAWWAEALELSLIVDLGAPDRVVPPAAWGAFAAVYQQHCGVTGAEALDAALTLSA